MSPRPLVPRIVEMLIAWRWLCLALAAAAVVVSYGQARRLEFDRSIENMFAVDDPLLTPFRRLRRTFGGDEVALAVYVDPALMTPAGYVRVEKLTAELKQVDGVAGVLSLSESPLGAAVIDQDLPASRAMMRLFEGYAVGEDRQTAAVVCLLKPEGGSTVARPETILAMRAIVEAHDPSGVLAGEPVMVVDGFDAIDRDGRRLSWTATALMILTIIICFRSARWVVVPLAVVFAALVWTQAILVLGHFRLSMVSTMLAAVVMVIGIATVVHVIVRFREARGLGLSPRGALAAAGGLTAAPVFWACTTDAAGFSSLLTARVGPVQDFGAMMALGSLVTLVSAALVLPGLALAGGRDADPKHAWGEHLLEAWLERLAGWIERHPRRLFALSLPPMLAAAVGCAWLEVETDFTKNFRAGSRVVTAYSLVESRLGGAGVWDVVLPAPERIDHGYLDRLRRLERRLRTEVTVIDADGQRRPGLTKVLSLVDAIDAAPAPPLLRRLAPPELMLGQIDDQMPVIAGALRGVDPTGDDQNYFRIMLRARERQPSSQKQALIQQVRRIAREEFPRAEVTGYFVLLASLIESIIQDQWRAFAVAALGIGAMMTLAFRSPRLGLTALAPNVLPILVVTGLMGWLGVKINMGAAMIAAVSIGLAIDSSIHYIATFQRLTADGRSTHEAIHLAHQTVGRAMILSTLALIIGFSSMCFSQFVPTIYFGVLVSLAMLGGLVGNLVVLPLLLAAAARPVAIEVAVEQSSARPPLP